eukprot:m51a1_g5134 hypothetical protein (318) ;mRNA; f:984-2030
MRALCVCAVGLVLVAASSASTVDTFRAWAKSHGRVYTAEEEKYRLSVFEQNLAVIDRLNREGHGAHFGLTRFSDLTNDEFAAKYASHASAWDRLNATAVVPAPSATANGVWSEDGCLDMRTWVAPVKNQEECAADCAESAYYKARGKVISLSEQQLIACDRDDSGCGGGDLASGFSYVVANGLATEQTYPYASDSGVSPACQPFESFAKYATYKMWTTKQKDENLMLYLRTYGPLSIGMSASSTVIQNYVSGILDTPDCGSASDHAVELVGYGTENTQRYWIVRNSWGTAWGESGHIRLIRGKNMCGVNAKAGCLVA